MVSYLKYHFVEDENRQHFAIDPSLTAAERRRPRLEFRIKDCMSYCVIAVNQYGDIMARDILNIEDKYLPNLDFRGNDM